METKICTKCKLEKPTNLFNKCSSKKDSLQCECKHCHNKLYQKYYLNNKERFRLNSFTRRLNIKLFINAIKESGCNICGETDIACLDFHHLQDKKYNISQLIKIENFIKIKEEIDKCIVLCSNCHRKLHYYKH